MSLKILVTGRNRRIATDICEHLESDRGYVTLKCPPTKDALLDMVPSEMPHVIILCLRDENRNTIGVYDILNESSKLGVTNIIVITNNVDRKVFVGNTELKSATFLSRPVSLFALYVKLDEIEKKVKDDSERMDSLFDEFVNPNAIEEFPRKHILVVDDDVEQLTQIKEHLREFYEVSLVGSGNNAFKFLERFKVDLILLDYLMPEMNGPEVLTLLRENPDYAYIPVMFLTGVSEKETVVKTLVELKPQGYVLKPTTKPEIVAKIIQVLG